MNYGYATSGYPAPTAYAGANFAGSWTVPTTGPDFSQINAPIDPLNLFVSNLPIEINEEQLRAMFEPFGQVVSTKIMVDPTSQTSRGIGFVKFTTPAAATTAIENMNEATVSGKKLGVKHATLTARSANVGVNSSGTPNANLYIRGIPQTMTQTELQTLFSAYGTIEQSRILTDPATGQSKGQAFVRFATVEAASYAIQALNGYTFEGQLPVGILVKYADTVSDKAQRASTTPAAGRGGRADFTSAGRGRGARFTPYGQGHPVATPYASPYGMPDGYAAYPGQPGYPVPYGAIPFAAPTPAAAAKAGGAGGHIGALGPNGEANLFVYHLPSSADEAMLQSLFSTYGTVLSTRVMRDPATRMCKGFGFVRMANLEAANAAIQGLNGYQIENKRLLVNFKT